MSTPLDAHVLRQLPELAAAQQLVAMNRVELWAAAQALGLKPKARASKEDLIAAILTATHPQPAHSAPAQQYQQERLV